MPMRITGARWTSNVNILAITCCCGREFEHKANRWNVECPLCRRIENLAEVRANEENDHGND